MKECSEQTQPGTVWHALSWLSAANSWSVNNAMLSWLTLRTAFASCLLRLLVSGNESVCQGKEENGETYIYFSQYKQTIADDTLKYSTV